MQFFIQKLHSSKYLQALVLYLLGASCVLGFAPYYIYPISILSAMGLCYFWFRAHSAKQAAVVGFIYGLGLYTVGIYWIYISLHVFGGMPSLMAGFSTLVLCAFMALFLALTGALSIKLTARQPKYLFIAIPLFWALSDWVRSWIFTGFPWLTMGYSQVPYSPLAGYMPIIGVYGVSMFTILLAALACFWLMSLKSSVDSKLSCGSRSKILIIFLVIWIGGSLLKLVEWSAPIGKPISVALLQGNIAQDIKWSSKTAVNTINQYMEMVKASQADLIVLPETALPVIASRLDPFLKEEIVTHMRKVDGNLIVGMVEKNDQTGEYFNSAFSFGSASNQTYAKNHLVPFGEFIPLKQVFGWIYRDWLNMPLSDLSRGGTHQTPMKLGNQKVAVNVCYEDVFGEEIIRQLPEATLLVNMSNDAWYGQSYAAYQHLQFSQARALETGRMVLRATNTGATAIIDQHGNVMAPAPHDKKIILEGTAQGFTGATPYVRFGNWLFLFISFIALLFITLPKISARIKPLLGIAKTK